MWTEKFIPFERIWFEYQVWTWGYHFIGYIENDTKTFGKICKIYLERYTRALWVECLDWGQIFIVIHTKFDKIDRSGIVINKMQILLLMESKLLPIWIPTNHIIWILGGLKKQPELIPGLEKWAHFLVSTSICTPLGKSSRTEILQKSNLQVNRSDCYKIWHIVIRQVLNNCYFFRWQC